MLNFGKKAEAASAAELKNWYKDRYQYALVWRNILAVMTLIALAVSLFSVLAVKELTPLKSVEPFVIQVDDKTGITQVVNPLTVKEYAANEAINNFFLVQYIRTRETYDGDYRNTTYYYNTVRVMSEPRKVYEQFRREVSRENSDSPANRLSNEGRRFVKFRSISYIAPNIAQVRLTIEEEFRGETRTRNKIATVTFEYQNVRLNTEERFMNPLGFIVKNYRLDEDVVSP